VFEEVDSTAFIGQRFVGFLGFVFAFRALELEPFEFSFQVGFAWSFGFHAASSFYDRKAGPGGGPARFPKSAPHFGFSLRSRRVRHSVLAMVWPARRASWAG
jgi:hypothetical protein